MLQRWTLPLTRRSPVHLPRRDLVLGAGDTLVLRLSVVQADTAAPVPVDLAGYGPVLWVQVWGDFAAGLCTDYGAMVTTGRLLTVVPAVITDGEGGQADVSLSPSLLRSCGRRLGYSIQVDQAGDVTTIAWGAMHVAPGANVGRNTGILTDDDQTPITADDDAEIGV